jgi:endonuclease YncB( thermonuclease family)
MVSIKCDNFDKYGRLLVYIYLTEPDQSGGSYKKKNSNVSINSWLIENNYAFKYNGGTKQRWDII